MCSCPHGLKKCKSCYDWKSGTGENGFGERRARNTFTTQYLGGNFVECEYSVRSIAIATAITASTAATATSAFLVLLISEIGQ
jgi:hypothetical protein